MLSLRLKGKRAPPPPGPELNSQPSEAVAQTASPERPPAPSLVAPAPANNGLPPQTSAPRSGFRRTFIALEHPPYRNLWFGMLLQMTGMQMQMMAMGYFIYELTGSPALLGIGTAVSAIPALTLGLYGGVLADRFDKKRIIQAGQAVSMLLVVCIALAITTHVIVW